MNSAKQADEFGLHRRMQLAAMLVYLPTVHALGPEVAQAYV